MTSAPPDSAADGERAQEPPLRFHRTTFYEPFRRVNIPPTHRFGPELPEEPGPGQEAPLSSVRIDGRGYDCGCRSTKDYDQKIGKEIGQEISDTLAKIIPAYAAFRALQAGLSALVKNIPGIGPKIAELIDDADPIKALLKWVGGQVDGMLVENLFRSVPAWVPVLRNAPIAKDFEEQEVEGYLVRSHQRHDGIPYSQWHLWYDWSFLVSPVGATFDMVGDGNRRRAEGGDPGLAQLQLDSRRYERHWMPPSANIDYSLQCEWDLGAIGPHPLPSANQLSNFDGGAFFSTGKLDRDWGWPMTGQYFWAGGRSMYDCRYSTSDERDQGLHLNQLRPLKAIATARWEGFRFPENQAAVPAIQFVFFASNAVSSGGDFKFKALNACDYEFVIQLPPGGFGVPSTDPYPLGAVPKYLLNTIDIGRRLLVHHTSEPFTRGVHHPTRTFPIEPVVTPVFTSRDRPPTHAHVRIPLTKLPRRLKESDPEPNDYYGVVVTLGWHDPARSLAREVYEVTVTFRTIDVFDAKESGQAEWYVNFGVNGRWFQRLLVFDPSGSGPSRRKLDGASVTLFLAERDLLYVSCHGLEQDGEGDQFELPIEDSDPEKPPKDAPKSEWDAWIKAHLNTKQLRLSEEVDLPTGVNQGQVETTRVDLPFVGEVVDWKRHVDQPVTPEGNAIASKVARALFLRTATYAFDANDPLGLVDPNIFQPTQPFGRRNDGTDTPNPQALGDIVKAVGDGGTKQCRHTGYAMIRMGRMGTLGYDETPRELSDDDPSERHDVRVDYVLCYDVTVRRQDGGSSGQGGSSSR